MNVKKSFIIFYLCLFYMVQIFAAAQASSSVSADQTMYQVIERFGSVEAATDSKKKETISLIKSLESLVGDQDIAAFLQENVKKLGYAFFDELLLNVKSQCQVLADKLKRSLVVLHNGSGLIHSFLKDRALFVVRDQNLCIATQWECNSAIISWYCYALRALIKGNRAQVKLVNSDGKTPLHLACDISEVEFRDKIIALLLVFGAQPDFKNAACVQSAREYAESKGLKNVFSSQGVYTNLIQEHVFLFCDVYERNMQAAIDGIFLQSNELLNDFLVKRSQDILTIYRLCPGIKQVDFLYCDNGAQNFISVLSLLAVIGDYQGIADFIQGAGKGCFESNEKNFESIFNVLYIPLNPHNPEKNIDYKKRVQALIKPAVGEVLLQLFKDVVSQYPQFIEQAYKMYLLADSAEDEALYFSWCQMLIPYYQGGADENSSEATFYLVNATKSSGEPSYDKVLRYKKIMRYLAQYELTQFKKEHKLKNFLLTQLIVVGCFEQLDELQGQPLFKALYDVLPDVSIRILKSYVQDQDYFDQKLLSKDELVRVKKTIFRFFMYAFDMGLLNDFQKILKVDKKSAEYRVFQELATACYFDRICFIHRAVYKKNIELVELLLQVAPESLTCKTQDGLTPICCATQISDVKARDTLVNFFKEQYKAKKIAVTEQEQSYLDGGVKARKDKLRGQWKELIKKSQGIEQKKNRFEAGCQKQTDDWERQAAEILDDAFLEKNNFINQKVGAQAYQQHEFQAQKLGQAWQDDMGRLSLEQKEDQARIALLKKLDDRYALFQAGRLSREVELEQMRQRTLQFQAMSPSKLSNSQSSSIPSSTKLSVHGGDFNDDDLQTSLPLTPKGQSKITYFLGGDSMAMIPQKVKLENSIIDKLNQLSACEGNPMVPSSVFSSAIPCDPRVESMRATTIALDKGALEHLCADGYQRLDHAMSTDFIRKVVQCGSVYGQLRKKVDGNWVFNVLIVASIQDIAYSGQLESLSGRVPKKWVTLGFEVNVPTGAAAELVTFGDIYHFCVQETHPRFIVDEQGCMKFFLVPLSGVVGGIENRVLRLKCDANQLRGSERFLRRIRDAYLVNNQVDFSQYKNQWRPVTPESPQK